MYRNWTIKLGAPSGLIRLIPGQPPWRGENGALDEGLSGTLGVPSKLLFHYSPVSILSPDPLFLIHVVLFCSSPQHLSFSDAFSTQDDTEAALHPFTVSVASLNRTLMVSPTMMRTPTPSFEAWLISLLHYSWYLGWITCPLEARLIQSCRLFFTPTSSIARCRGLLSSTGHLMF